MTELDKRQLQQAIANQDPIEFVAIEKMLKQAARDRAPKWSPSQVLSPTGMRRYRQGQDTIRLVDEMCEQMWQQLAEGILRARNEMVAWQAGQALRELQFAEQLRQTRDMAELNLQISFKQQQINDHFAALASQREFEYARILQQDKFDHEARMMGATLSKDDPVYKVLQLRESMDVLKGMLEDIYKNEDTISDVKHQQAYSLMNIYSKLF